MVRDSEKKTANPTTHTNGRGKNKHTFLDIRTHLQRQRQTPQHPSRLSSLASHRTPLTTPPQSLADPSIKQHSLGCSHGRYSHAKRTHQMTNQALCQLSCRNKLIRSLNCSQGGMLGEYEVQMRQPRQDPGGHQRRWQRP